MAERVETDSTVDLQLPIDDSLELSAAAELLETSDAFEDQFLLVDNVPPATSARSASPRAEADHLGFVANSIDSTSATQGTPASEVRLGFHSSSLSDRIRPSQLGWPDRDLSGIGHQVPSVSGSLPASRVVDGPDATRIDMSANGPLRSPSETGELLHRLPVDSSSARNGATARPRSEEPNRDRAVQGGHGGAPPVIGRLADPGFAANAVQIAGHINPVSESVQGLRFVGMPAPPVTVVSQVALPSVHAATSAATSVVPAFVDPNSGRSFVPFRSAPPARSALSARSASPARSAPSASPAIPASSAQPAQSAFSARSASSALSAPSAIPALPAQSASPYPWLYNGMSQFIQRPSGSGITDAPSVTDNVGQTAAGTVTVPAGYQGPWDWSNSFSTPVGPMGTCGWQNGFPPSVGPAGTAGWVGGFPEQVSGTAVAAPTMNAVTTPVVSPMSVPGNVTYAVGASGLPVPPPEVIAAAAARYISSFAGVAGNAGWPLGLSEQARGMAPTAVTGVAEPRVVPQLPPGVSSQQSEPSEAPSAPGSGGAAAAPVPETAEGSYDEGESERHKGKNMQLPSYNGLTSLETFLAKFERMSKYLKWKAEDRLNQLCATLDGPAGQILWGLTDSATAETVIALLNTQFGNDLQTERFRAELRA